jgi:hypothetical protein
VNDTLGLVRSHVAQVGSRSVIIFEERATVLMSLLRGWLSTRGDTVPLGQEAARGMNEGRIESDAERMDREGSAAAA